MRQSRIESFIEININIAIGFILSMILWSFVIVPAYDLPVGARQNFEIVGWFTLLAIARGYVVRRFFNAELHKIAHSLAIKFINLCRRKV